MLEALVLAAVVVAALACPLMAWLGRRGVGPGCVWNRRATAVGEEGVEGLRERELAARIARPAD